MSSPKSLALRRLANLSLPDTELWLALAEDQLKETVPQDSQVFGRFLKLKKATETTDKSGKQSDGAGNIQDIRSLIIATCDWLDAQPYPTPDNLKEEVERIIQTGYFKSPYFRAILALFGLALLLVTGISSFKIYDQVQAMQRMMDETRKQTADMAAQVAAAKVENKNREADLALLIAQGNVDLAKQRANAIYEIQQSTDLFRTDINTRAKKWTGDVEQAGSEAKQHIVDAGGEGEKQVRKTTESTIAQYQKQVSDALVSTIGSLQAAENPWVPKVIWSIARKWLFVPLALFISLAAWLIAASVHFKFRNGFIKGVIAVSAIAAAIVAFFLIK
jgi:hypothetical protein